MHTDLMQARGNLKKKLMNNAEIVIKQILDANLDGMIEIGLFGSVVKNNFTSKSDSDIYLLFEKSIPDRITKGYLRSVAEENNCDIVFLTEANMTNTKSNLLAKNVSDNKIVLWRKKTDDKK